MNKCVYEGCAEEQLADGFCYDHCILCECEEPCGPNHTRCANCRSGLRSRLLKTANAVKNRYAVEIPVEIQHAAFHMVASVHMKATFGDATAIKLLEEIDELDR